MRRLPRFSTLCATLLLGLIMAQTAHARVRKFSYSRESGAPTAGAAEFQFWSTDRAGREQRFNQLDNRLEVEVGVSERLMTAFYLNTSANVQGEGASRSASSGVTGVTTEWKYTLTDGPAPVGTAIFFDATGRPEAMDSRLKFIVDGTTPSTVWAVNVTANGGIDDLGGENTQRLGGELNGGFAFVPTPELSVGAEVWSFAVRNQATYEGLTVYAGPAVTWSPGAVWISATLLGQVGTLGGPEGTFTRDLVRRESVNFRLLFGRAL